MPPRRSTRASLPTPAQSLKAESIASTPGKISSRRQSGLLTPTSMADASEYGKMEDAMEIDQFQVKVERDVKTTITTGTKRKASYDENSSAFDVSPTRSITSSSSVSTDRYTIDSVVLPSRRSKLSTEKTTSADNLTLASPAGRKLTGRSSMSKVEPDQVDAWSEEDDADSEIHDEPKMQGKGKSKVKVENGGRPEHQPFNVGKFSSVRKEKVDELALDSDDSIFDEEKKSGKKGSRTAKPKGKPRGKGKKAADESEESDHVKEEIDDDFAMDSDAEDKQLQKAIKESMAQDIKPGTSSRSSSLSVRGKGRGRGKSQAVGGRNNSATLRKAAAKAAEKRAAHDRGEDTPFSIDSGATSDSDSKPFAGTPISKTADSSALPSGSATPMDYEDFSDDSDLSDMSDFSDDSDAPRGRGKKGKGKKGKSGWGAGRRLETGDVEPGELDPGLLDDMDVETRAKNLQLLREQHRRRRAELEAEMKPIKRAEKELKAKLKRKLTNGEKNLIRLQHHHAELADVWGDLAETIKPVKPTPMEAHPSLKLTLLPFQKESLFWMKKQEEGPWKGGMLADEMGMGKTIQTIALLLSEPRRKPSLVVAPVVALMQWKHEIETHAEGFKVCLWHGQSRMQSAELKKYDVVLSSYGTLEAAFRRQQRGFKKGNVFVKEKSPMHDHKWFRVVLDEAHNIKERSTNAAKAAFALNAEYKWCLSGTPLQNRVGELYSLVRFLGADPFSHYFCKKCDCKSLHWAFKDKRSCDQCGHSPMHHVCFWNTEILTPIAKYGIEAGNPGHTAFKKLKILLDRMMLRRTKLERADDLGLPPRTIVVRRDYFSPAEAELYKSLFTDAKRTFATYIDQGTVLNNYSNIFSLITRMRQMACHPDLVLKSRTSALGQALAEGTVCRICNDQAEDAIVSQCKHVFDRECIRQYLEVQQTRGKAPECPVCHIEISIDLEAEAIDLEAYAGATKGKAKQGILSRLDLDNWTSSSKLEALLEELEKLRDKDATIKSLVFSQFVSFLDLIAFRLQRAGFNICRLEGGMTPQQRDATIQHFMKNTEVTVFLISLKAGGVALNLTEASMVFMMDSWWNPSVEYQAMDRIHRLGQKRPVKVVKLVVEDSIEEQIVALQAKKLAMTEAALSTDPDAALGKLTVEDLGFLFKM